MMSQSRKYGRTYHYPFSPGTTNDDRINFNYWHDLASLETIVHTEKLDGENTCLNQYGVFARSHAAPTQHPWANYLKEKWTVLRHDLGNLELFGENLYAVHSIEYQQLEDHFFVFGIRELDRWLSWEETKFYAAMLDFKTVPELLMNKPEEIAVYEETILQLVQQESRLGSYDVYEQKACSMEGIVSRNACDFGVDDFKSNVWKYVRKGHVKTDQHWTKNWKRAPLLWEKKQKS